jgi:hypothetical protein
MRSCLHNAYGSVTLQPAVRPAELGMRAAEEPLRSDVDVKGIKAQVLRRVEKLEERENLLSEILPEMEARGTTRGP